MALKKFIKNLRQSRKLHRYLGTGLALFLLISALTGVLLSWKKDIDLIQPATSKGESKNLSEWLPLDQLDSLAHLALTTAQPAQYDNTVDRLDIRPSKGIVKALFKNGYWEVQLDGKTGEVKSIAKRHSDWIEALHDGSIISDSFKLISMNILGWGLLLMILTGLWLWYGPKRFRLLKKRYRQKKIKGKQE